MKRRIQLSTNALRHYRESRGLTRKQVAEDALRKGPDQSQESLVTMYGRLERTGIAGEDHANRIANFYNVPLEHLLDCPEASTAIQEATLWFIGPDERSGGEIACGLLGLKKTLDHFLNPIRDSIRDDGDQVWMDATIDATGARTVFTHVPSSGATNTHLINIKPMTLGAEGYLWTRVSKHAAQWIEDVIRREAMIIADSICVSGKEVGSHSDLAAFQIREFRVSGGYHGKSELLRSNMCSKENLLSELPSLIRDADEVCMDLDPDLGSVNVYLLDSNRHIQVRKVELDQDKSVVTVPWPERRRRKIMKMLKNQIDATGIGPRFMRFDQRSKAFVEEES